jgi:hypothetical protein
MLRFMFIVRGMSEIDSASFACGTTERALDKVLSCSGDAFRTSQSPIARAQARQTSFSAPSNDDAFR